MDGVLVKVSKYIADDYKEQGADDQRCRRNVEYRDFMSKDGAAEIHA